MFSTENILQVAPCTGLSCHSGNCSPRSMAQRRVPVLTQDRLGRLFRKRKDGRVSSKSPRFSLSEFRLSSNWKTRCSRTWAGSSGCYMNIVMDVAMDVYRRIGVERRLGRSHSHDGLHWLQEFSPCTLEQTTRVWNWGRLQNSLWAFMHSLGLKLKSRVVSKMGPKLFSTQLEIRRAFFPKTSRRQF